MRSLVAALILIAALAAAVRASASEIVVASVYFPGDGVVPKWDYRTSSGQRYDAKAMKVACIGYPLGTKLYLHRGRCAAEVTCNDHGPFIKGRKLDLTPAVNKALCMDGLDRVIVEVWPPLPREKPK